MIPPRNTILDLLRTRDRTTSELVECIGIGHLAVNQELGVLRAQGRVEVIDKTRRLWGLSDAERAQ